MQKDYTFSCGRLYPVVYIVVRLISAGNIAETLFKGVMLYDMPKLY